jgi:hypothetical protein
MKIDRNNYENFFLLYIDDELDNNQKKIVDDFLLSNTDLFVEFNLLKQAKLSTPYITNFNKTSLYKHHTNSINKHNYSEKFILYIDNELSSKEKEEVENYVLQNPELQTEFLTLKSSVLSKEKIIYPYKEGLLKKERKPIVMFWYKPIAIAASIILLVVALWQFNFNSKISTNNNLAINHTITTFTDNEKQLTPKLNNTNQTATVDDDKISQKIVTYTSNYVNKKELNRLKKEKLSTEMEGNNNIENSITYTEEDMPNIIVVKQKSITKNSIKHLNNNFIQQSESMSTLANATTTNEENTKPIFKFLDINEENETNVKLDKTVTIGSFKIKKNKLKNILHKASNAISNPLNKNNEKIEVATL